MAMLRDLVLLRMGRCGDEATVAEARRRFEDHCSGKQSISADLRSTVSGFYNMSCNAIKTACTVHNILFGVSDQV